MWFPSSSMSSIENRVLSAHSSILTMRGSTAASTSQFPLLLQLRDHLRVRRVAIYCDDARPRMTRSLQGPLEELLGRSRISLSGKPEVDRGAGGIDSTIQVPPFPTLANVGFVDPPGAVGRFQFAPASLVQFGGIALHPAPNAGVISRETSFYEQFLDVPIRKREPQIPTDRANNDLGFEVPPFEQRWPRFDHGIYCSLSDSFNEFLQHSPMPDGEL
jgi:hypothetical protein